MRLSWKPIVLTLLLSPLVIFGIYVPGQYEPQTGSSNRNLNAKILNWQTVDDSEGGVEISQNYANVKVHKHDNDENLRKVYEDNRDGRNQRPEDSFWESSTAREPKPKDSKPLNLYGPQEIDDFDSKKDVYAPLSKYNGQPPPPTPPSRISSPMQPSPRQQSKQHNSQQPIEEPLLPYKNRLPPQVPSTSATISPKHQLSETVTTDRTPKGFYITRKPKPAPRIPRNYYSGHKAYKEAAAKLTQSYTKCPPGATGQFPYDGSCSRYLNCWKGRGYAQNCPPGTLFNGDTLECDFPDKVQCDKRSARQLSVSNLGHGQSVQCPQGFSGLIPHYNDCAKFISCNMGQLNEMDCPPGTLFDVKSNMCDFAAKAQCANGQSVGASDPDQNYGQSQDHDYDSGHYGNPGRFDQSTQRPSGLDYNPGQGNFELRDPYGLPSTIYIDIERHPTDNRQNVRPQIRPGNINPNGPHLTPGGSYGPIPIPPTDQGSNYDRRNYSQPIHGNQNIGPNHDEFDPQQNREDFPGRPTTDQGSNYGRKPDGHRNPGNQNVSPNQDGFDPLMNRENIPGRPTTGQGSNYGRKTFGHNIPGNQNPSPNYDEFDPYQSTGSPNNYRPYGSQTPQILNPQKPPTIYMGIGRPVERPHPIPNPYADNPFLSSPENSGAGQRPINYDPTNIYAQPPNIYVDVDRNTGHQRPMGHNVKRPVNHNYITPRPIPDYYPGQSNTPVQNPSGSNQAPGGTYSRRPNRPIGSANSQSFNSQTGLFGPNIQYGPGDDLYLSEHTTTGYTTRKYQKNPFLQSKPNPYGNNNKNQGTNQNASQPMERLINTVPECPAGVTGLSEHPSDCSKFLNCANGLTYIMDCGPGTMFNAQSKICDYPHNVQCSSSTANNLESNFPHLDLPPEEEVFSPVEEVFPPVEEPFPPNEELLPPNEELLPPNEELTGQETKHPQNPYTYSPQEVIDDFGPWQTQSYNQQASTLPNFNQQEVEDWITESPEKTPESDGTGGYRSKHWPPPFPSTDVNADYVFEYEDLMEPDINIDPPKLEPLDWCDNKGFECGNKICINPSHVCDGKTDCPYGNDEYQCDRPIKQFTLTPGTKLAVKESKKATNITLKWCAKICLFNGCKSFNYRKLDGTCFILDSNVPLSGALIMLPMYDYYEDARSMKSCSELKGFECPNRKCIGKKQLCDGQNDCGDGTDEKGCDAKNFDYKLKLVGGQDRQSGRLEVSAFGKSGYICDDMFGMKNADVACKELGFELGAAEVKGLSYYAQEIADNDTVYLMDDVSCLGNETSLRDCDFSGWGVHNCRPQEIVGIVCKTPLNKCPKDHWQCQNALECLPLAFVCDGVYDCSDKSDEDSGHCDSPVGLRLSGINGTKGRVEVQYHGIWGTVCDDDFNDDAAKVVCRQLGFTGSAKVVKDGLFGPGTGPIWLDQVFCKGNESELHHCVHWDWGEHNCEHAEDVGVICANNDYGDDDRDTRNMKQHPESDQNEDEEDENLFPESCGLRNDAIFGDSSAESDVHFRVVQSPVAKTGEYPWQASIRVASKTKSAHWCGAVVISSKYVLTAAHCLRGFSKGAYYVVAGDYNVDKDEGTEQKAFIDDFIVHPNYGHGNKMKNDIAVIRLKHKGFILDKHIRAICLPDQELPWIGSNCTISGFGSIESGKSRASKDLRAGWIPILPSEVCKMPHVYGEALTEGMMCAGFLEKNGVDACEGDSGGPLACLNEGVFKLYGITSWGQHCGYANKPGVYVSVANYREWIEEAMKQLAKT